jgi:hypothetical protein
MMEERTVFFREKKDILLVLLLKMDGMAGEDETRTTREYECECECG